MVYTYKEGKGQYAGTGLYVANEPGLGFVYAVGFKRKRLFYMRHRWGHKSVSNAWFCNIFNYQVYPKGVDS